MAEAEEKVQMIAVEYIEALKPIVVKTINGPADLLAPNGRMRADKVHPPYLEDIRNGGRNSTRAKIIEIQEPAGSSDPDNFGQQIGQASKSEGRAADDNTIKPFDPVGQKVSDIVKYLEGDKISDDEIIRVKVLEAQNKQRQGGPSSTIAQFERKKEGE